MGYHFKELLVISDTLHYLQDLGTILVFVGIPKCLGHEHELVSVRWQPLTTSSGFDVFWVREMCRWPSGGHCGDGRGGGGHGGGVVVC